MNINATLILQLLVFFALAYFTMKYIWPPLIRALDERRSQIAEGLAAAEKGKEDLKLAEKYTAEKFAKVRQECQRRVEEAEREAQSIISAATIEAEKEAQNLLHAAEADAAAQVRKAREMLQQEVALLAVEGAREILQREVDASAHADLLNNLKGRLA